ncbi:MAG: ATP phosphoribosyltransferase [bacterium]|nr:ATP phosphoribosyltransferase [bacterium]
MIKDQRPVPLGISSSNIHADIARFSTARLKVALQRDGRLTEISRQILSKELGIEEIPLPRHPRIVVSSTDDGEVGFHYAKTSALCGLIADFSAHLAVVGNYQIIEGNYKDKVRAITSYGESWLWPLVIATSSERQIKSIEQVRRIATRYPVMTRHFFDSIGMAGVEIIFSEGGVEVMPYTLHNGWNVDAVVDLVSTGETLSTYGLVQWDPPISYVYPVLIGDIGFRRPIR